MKIKKGDQITIMAGKDRGRSGQVEKILTTKGAVVVPGLNQYKKHRKPGNSGQTGEILTLSRPIPVQKVALMCPKCKQPTRVGYQLVNEKKVRVCRKCDQQID